MTGPELRAIRERLGLTQEAFGIALGYKGPNVRQVISVLEREVQQIPVRTALLAQALASAKN